MISILSHTRAQTHSILVYTHTHIQLDIETHALWQVFSTWKTGILSPLKRWFKTNRVLTSCLTNDTHSSSTRCGTTKRLAENTKCRVDRFLILSMQIFCRHRTALWHGKSKDGNNKTRTRTYQDFKSSRISILSSWFWVAETFERLSIVLRGTLLDRRESLEFMWIRTAAVFYRHLFECFQQCPQSIFFYQHPSSAESFCSNMGKGKLYREKLRTSMESVLMSVIRKYGVM